MIPLSFLRIVIGMLAPDLPGDILNRIVALAQVVRDPDVFYAEVNKIIADSPIRGES